MYLFTVICDPPCDHGKCVGNNHCECEIGYIGNNCSHRLFIIITNIFLLPCLLWLNAHCFKVQFRL